jgi:hypothetical protein
VLVHPFVSARFRRLAAFMIDLSRAGPALLSIPHPRASTTRPADHHRRESELDRPRARTVSSGAGLAPGPNSDQIQSDLNE